MVVKLYSAAALLFLVWAQYSKGYVDTNQGPNRGPKDKPNILMIVIDDLGWNDTSYQGSEIPTPTIDKFSKEAIRLQQYYVQRTCSPSRAAIMTGRYPYHLGLARAVIKNGYPFGLSLDQTTLADELKKGGYGTHCIGKWDLGMHKWEYTPNFRGFDSFYGLYNAGGDHFTHVTFTVDDLIHGNRIFYGLDLRNDTLPDTSKNGSYSTELYTQVIIQAIKKHERSKAPFFIYASYQAVHIPLQAPQKYLDQCQFIPYEARRKFCGLLVAADEGIANITNVLEEKNMLKDTIIIFTTDNGGQTAAGSSNLPLRGGKNTMFEGGVRGVGFVWGASLPSYDNEQLIHVTDWLPTIVEGIAGLQLDRKTKDALDGYNIWPTIIANSRTPRREILINLDPAGSDHVAQAAIRIGNWKLITGRPNCSLVIEHPVFPCPDGWIHVNGTIEPPPYTPSLTWLFNIQTDPNERNNVADQYPWIVQFLKSRIEYYNATHIEQFDPPLDNISDPANFNGIWTPWLTSAAMSLTLSKYILHFIIVICSIIAFG